MHSAWVRTYWWQQPRGSRACRPRIVSKQWENQDWSLFLPCRRKTKTWGEKRIDKWMRYSMVSLWRIKGACVYLSSPIDHHLKQEEWGREKFSSVRLVVDTWVQRRPLHGSSHLRHADIRLGSRTDLIARIWVAVWVRSSGKLTAVFIINHYNLFDECKLALAS